jgi:hypothetical protein
MKNFLLKTRGSYLRSDKKRNVSHYVIPIAIVFAVLYGGSEIVAKVSSLVTFPFYAVRHYMEESTATVPVFFRSRLALDTELKTLKQEIAERKGHDATLAYLITENTELRNMLHSSSTPRIMAGVISRPPETPYDTMLIDRGSNDGIVENAPVYFSAGQAIGYVQSVFPDSAHVTLFSSPGVESTVYVFGPNIFTTAYGEGGGIIRLSVPQGIKISTDNIVILPSLEQGVLGKIDDIQSIPTEPEQHAYMTFDASLQSIRLVGIGVRPIQKAKFSDAEFHIQTIEKELFTFDVPENYTLTHTSTSSSPSGDSEEINDIE